MTIDMATADLGALRPIELLELQSHAELLERVDRKYLVPARLVPRLAEDLTETHRVLTIAGRTSTGYETRYFDTPDLQCVRDHIQGRRRRYKVRSRLYVEDSLCRVEVKLKGARSQTVKAQLNITADDHGELTPDVRRFIATTLRQSGTDVSAELGPSLALNCRRSTLADTRAGVRVTIDTDLTCHDRGGRFWLNPDYVVIETKGSAKAGRADLLLRAAGYRPQAFSKYTAAGCLLTPDIPHNSVHRLLGRELLIERHAS